MKRRLSGVTGLFVILLMWVVIPLGGNADEASWTKPVEIPLDKSTVTLCDLGSTSKGTIVLLYFTEVKNHSFLEGISLHVFTSKDKGLHWAELKLDREINATSFDKEVFANTNSNFQFSRSCWLTDEYLYLMESSIPYYEGGGISLLKINLETGKTESNMISENKKIGSYRNDVGKDPFLGKPRYLDPFCKIIVKEDRIYLIRPLPKEKGVYFTMSKDGGKTWEKMQEVPLKDLARVELECDYRIESIPFFMAGDTLNMIYVSRVSKKEDYQYKWLQSTDEGKTWKEVPGKMWKEVDMVPPSESSILDEKARLSHELAGYTTVAVLGKDVYVGYLRLSEFDASVNKGAGNYHCFKSSDNGKTLVEAGAVNLQRGASIPKHSMELFYQYNLKAAGMALLLTYTTKILDEHRGDVSNVEPEGKAGYFWASNDAGKTWLRVNIREIFQDDIPLPLVALNEKGDEVYFIGLASNPTRGLFSCYKPKKE